MVCVYNIRVISITVIGAIGTYIRTLQTNITKFQIFHKNDEFVLFYKKKFNIFLCSCFLKWLKYFTSEV